ncbi:MAG TPA: hypothetical protein VHC90_22310 [Bryobacteraceae bacterium]|nr:hypothetical protein [Bryobacteraceae bacterium]
MDNKLTLVLVLAAGFAGSMLTRFIAPEPVFAQNAIAPNEVRARSFVLTDQEGHTVATLEPDPVNGGTWHRIVLRSADGKVIWAAGGSSIWR